MLLKHYKETIEDTTKVKVTNTSLANVLGTTPQNISKRIKNDSVLTTLELSKLEETFGVYCETQEFKKVKKRKQNLNEEFNTWGTRLHKIQLLKKLSDKEMTDILNITEGQLKDIICNDAKLPVEIILKIAENFNIDLNWLFLADYNDTSISSQIENIVEVLYRPNAYLSAEYGSEVVTEQVESILLDRKIFITDKGIRVNPNNCEVVAVSGNSMTPEYKHGDRVILDKSTTTFVDGHIFVFRYDGKCFMKEINIIGKRIKCISINKEYEPFFIEPNEDVTILGRVLPRIRL